MKTTLPLVTALCCLSVLCPPSAPAQRADEILASIREEGLERSRILQTLSHLTDVFGARLTGSPSVDRAGTWALQQLEAWGVAHAHKEPWAWERPGWENERLSAHLIAPVKGPLVCEVLAWTPGTHGTALAEAVHVHPPEHPTQAGLDAFFASVEDRVAGKIVLIGDVEIEPGRFAAWPSRWDDEEMAAFFDPDVEMPPPTPQEQKEPAAALLADEEVDRQINAFLKRQGVLVRVDPARRAWGIIRVFDNGSGDPTQTVPTVVMRVEDYGRLVRLLGRGLTVELEFTIVNRVYPAGRTAYNYLAEIPGTDKADEVIMLGAHLDSWHGATGATDNAVGVAVMMEAVRILKALGVAPRRTIRIALWTGEEQGLLGSRAYVAEHFGTFENPKPAYEAFGGYFNLDQGTGRLRGAFVFGPREAARVVEDVLAPLADLGVAGARPVFSRSPGGSDHTAFNQAGLPGINLLPDPLHYFTHTWHTNLDTYEHVLEDEARQAAVVVATSVYQLAMRDALLPRFSPAEMPPFVPFEP